ncbi:hypothetical protein [Deinococcus sp. RIT780]|uniref:hypothetical protein n=1 Tax=Deinococcus sp. RIT780 TaxID=2870472 RepID=UPI001C890879|nr:hypothetical protein [Deinococcus sp. RIT780]MBX8465014.1 hypothetical protein [Deinococcus sp. RIT780]
MKWEIDKISQLKTQYVVRIKRDLDSIEGIWLSELPSSGQTTYIELDINAFIEEINIIEHDQSEYSARVTGDTNELIGVIEEIDQEDSLHYFRISSDCLIMLESKGFRLSLGKFYKMSIPANIVYITRC